MIKYYKWFDHTLMKKRFNVLVTRRLHRSALEMLEEKCNVQLHSGKIPIPRKILINKIKDMNGLICHPYDTIDKEVISKAKNLKVISTFSVGSVSYTHLTLPTIYSV